MVFFIRKCCRVFGDIFWDFVFFESVDVLECFDVELEWFVVGCLMWFLGILEVDGFLFWFLFMGEFFWVKRCFYVGVGDDECCVMDFLWIWEGVVEICVVVVFVGMGGGLWGVMYLVLGFMVLKFVCFMEFREVFCWCSDFFMGMLRVLIVWFGR